MLAVGAVATVGMFYAAHWFKCNRVCPDVVDQMIEKTSIYKTLNDVFDHFGTCAPCVKYAKKRMPEIITADPLNSVNNTTTLHAALQKTGLDKAIV